MVSWKKNESKWKGVAPDVFTPYYHVVEFGNRQQSTKYRAIAKMPKKYVAAHSIMAAVVMV